MLVPLGEHKKALRALEKGIAVSVICNADDYEKHHRDNYYNMLGFTYKTKTKTCTILSEISNMANHYVVVGAGGNMVCGLHSDIFYVDVDEDDDVWREDIDEIEGLKPTSIDDDHDNHDAFVLKECLNVLEFCEDVFSRRPYSSELFYDGSHPQDRIEDVRIVIKDIKEIIDRKKS